MIAYLILVGKVVGVIRGFEGWKGAEECSKQGAKSELLNRLLVNPGNDIHNNNNDKRPAVHDQ